MGDYNKFAKKYQELTEKTEIKTRAHFYNLLPKKLKGFSLLDVGCGPGTDLVFYERGGAKISGFDISKKEIEIARKRVKCKLIVRDMSKKFPFGSNRFDIVTSVYALQASNDVPRTLKEMIRVAKRGALVLILVKHPFRNLIEGCINDNKCDYFTKGKATSYIFKRKIKLSEPTHTMMEYFNSEILKIATVELFKEYEDFPLSEQVIKNMRYPTYMIIKYRKK